MTDREMRSLIREMVEEQLRLIILNEGRKIGGYEVDDLDYPERDELEAFISVYIGRDDIESHKVRSLIAMGPATRTRRDPDDVSTITKKSKDPSKIPAAPMPTWPGSIFGEIAGWHESLKPTGKFGGTQNKDTGEWSRFRIKTKQADPHWIWTGKRWVSNADFDRLDRMGYLPEK